LSIVTPANIHSEIALGYKDRRGKFAAGDPLQQEQGGPKPTLQGFWPSAGKVVFFSVIKNAQIQGPENVL